MEKKGIHTERGDYNRKVMEISAKDYEHSGSSKRNYYER